MQLLIILALIALIGLWMRRPDEDRSQPIRGAGLEHEQQIRALARRVATLEAILLDRDRQLRDRFGDL